MKTCGLSGEQVHGSAQITSDQNISDEAILSTGCELRQEEIWKAIPDCARYEVSSLGRVRSKYRVVKPWKDSRGYFVVRFSSGENKSRKFVIHRLVAEMFVGNPYGQNIVCHIDGNKENNRADNLYWGSYIDNAQDSIRHGTFPLGSRHVFAKLSEEDIPVIKKMRGRRTAEQVAEFFGVHAGTITKIWANLTWRHV